MSIRYSLRTPTGQTTVITGPFRIGRDPQCQIRVDSDLVSRIHASIWIDHDHLLLRDERSRNGTRLNGQVLAPGEAHYLHHGDEVTIGDVPLIVESDPPYPRGHGGLGEAEPPPTAHLDKSQIPPPAAAPPGASAEETTAQPRRLPGWSIAVGGCVALALLVLCCAIGFVGATRGQPITLTLLAPLLRLTATPIP